MNRLLELPPEKQTPEQQKVFEQLVAGLSQPHAVQAVQLQPPVFLGKLGGAVNFLLIP